MAVSDVHISGPLFDSAVQRLVQAAVDGTVKELTDLGMQRLTAAFPTGVPVKSGNLQSHIHSMIEGPRGIIDDGGVVYSSWVEGTSHRNETTRFKGHGTYRKATQWLNERAPEVAEKHAHSLAQELGG